MSHAIDREQAIEAIAKELQAPIPPISGGLGDHYRLLAARAVDAYEALALSQEPSVQEETWRKAVEDALDEALDEHARCPATSVWGSFWDRITEGGPIPKRTLDSSQEPSVQDPPAGIHGRFIGAMWDPSDWPQERKARERAQEPSVTDEMEAAGGRAVSDQLEQGYRSHWCAEWQDSHGCKRCREIARAVLIATELSSTREGGTE